MIDEKWKTFAEVNNSSLCKTIWRHGRGKVADIIVRWDNRSAYVMLKSGWI